MLLIKKLTYQNKLNKNANYETYFVLRDYTSLMVKINKLKEIILNISNLRKKND